jgi:hypothetical protein
MDNLIVWTLRDCITNVHNQQQNFNSIKFLFGGCYGAPTQFRSYGAETEKMILANRGCYKV